MHKRLAKYIAAAAIVAAAVVAGLMAQSGPPGPRLLHTEPSDYAPVVVFEQYGERCMNFVEMEAAGRQSCMQLDDPDLMVFEYTRMMASALIALPQPRSILIIGLGGATLPIALHKALPEATIDSVELDPAVVRVAQEFFHYETGPRQRVFVDDGRRFVERVAQEGRRYDIVMLDAFDVDYIPAHLLTVEFLELVRGILNPGGLMVANSFAQSRMYERETATYAAVFNEFFNLRAGLEGNRVIIASAGSLPEPEQLQRNAAMLAPLLKPFGIDTQQAVAGFSVYRSQGSAADALRDPPQTHQGNHDDTP